MTSHIQTGQEGEDTAQAFLVREGYRILATNFRNPLGEIDVIAQDGRTICFIEIKTRRSRSKGTPLESVTPVKQRRLVKAALSYLKQHRLYDSSARFDVVSVEPSQQGPAAIRLIKNAFDLSDMPYR
jgi:putative endonuclease